MLNRTKRIEATIKPTKSLMEKYGWKGILSKFLLTPRGLLDPVSCRKIKCTITKAAITKGNRK
jgi:hypothetical protein